MTVLPAVTGAGRRGKEPVVDAIAAITAVMLLVDLLGGAMAGVFTGVSLASVSEDMDYSLTGAARSALCDGAQVIHGVSVRGTGFVTDALRRGGTGADNGDKDVPRENSDQDTQGQGPDQ
jgi:hypothetical protein